MDTETSNTQYMCFIHSSHSLLILFIFLKFYFTHKSFSPGLDTVTEQKVATNELSHWNNSPSKFFPLGCHSAASLLLVARWLQGPLWPPLQLLSRDSIAIHDSFTFSSLSTNFAISAVPSSTKFATSGLHTSEEGAKFRGQEWVMGTAPQTGLPNAMASPGSTGLPCTEWVKLLLRSQGEAKTCRAQAPCDNLAITWSVKFFFFFRSRAPVPHKGAALHIRKQFPTFPSLIFG